MLFCVIVCSFAVYWCIQRRRGKKTADDTRQLLASIAGATLGTVMYWVLRALVGVRIVRFVAISLILALVAFGLYNYCQDYWHCRHKK